jgi:hypothetical protein
MCCQISNPAKIAAPVQYRAFTFPANPADTTRRNVIKWTITDMINAFSLPAEDGIE